MASRVKAKCANADGQALAMSCFKAVCIRVELHGATRAYRSGTESCSMWTIDGPARRKVQSQRLVKMRGRAA